MCRLFWGGLGCVFEVVEGRFALTNKTLTLESSAMLATEADGASGETVESCGVSMANIAGEHHDVCTESGSSPRIAVRLRRITRRPSNRRTCIYSLGQQSVLYWV